VSTSRLARLGEALYFLLLSLGLTWPTVLSPGEAVLGHSSGDALKHLWNLWWMRSTVWADGASLGERIPYQTQVLNWPEGLPLYPIEPLNGLVAVGLPWLDLIVLGNLLVIGNLVLVGICGAWLGRLVSGSATAGCVAGTLLAASSVFASFVHIGAGELLHLWWIPLGLGVVVLAGRELVTRRFAQLAACLVAAAASCFYLGWFLGLAIATLALATLWPPRRAGQLGWRYLLTALISGALILPMASALSATLPGAGEVAAHGPAAEAASSWRLLETPDAPETRLDPSQVLVPGQGELADDEAAYGGGRYLGWVALGLAVLGLWRRPRDAAPWLAVGVVGAALSLGTWLTIGGTEVVVGGGRLELPASFLNVLLARLASPVNFPVRYMAITVVAVAVVASLAVPSEGRSRRRWIWVVLALLAAVEVSAAQRTGWPWARLQPTDAGAFEVIAGHRGHGLIDLALVVRPDERSRWSALSHQLAHQHPIQGVPIERVEYTARGGTWFVEALELVTSLKRFYARQPFDGGLDYRARHRKDLALLSDAGFGEILVSYRGGRDPLPPGLVAALTALCGPPVLSTHGSTLWSLPEVQATEAELARWRSEHATAVSELAAQRGGRASPTSR